MKKTCWTNQDNLNNYYNKPAIIKLLKNFAVKGGLESGIDVAHIYHLIKDKGHLLEVGGGFGRVTQHLLEKQFQGSISVIEKSDVFINELTKFDKQIKILHQDIMTYQEGKYDVILSMWSGISDFCPDEQANFIKVLSSLLDPNGIICIETLSTKNQPINAKSSTKKSYIIDQEGCVAHGYTPDYSELTTYCKSAHLKLIDFIEYETATSRKRVIYILKKDSPKSH